MTAISTKIRIGFSLLLVSMFVVFLCLPTLDSLFNLDNAPAINEKRSLAVFPKYTGLADLKSYITGAESYFNDHFGFRKRLIKTSNHWKRQLFAEASLNTVAVGSDGWLYYSGDKMIENYTGASRFTQQELNDWQKLLETRRDWLATIGCQYLFVVPPDKHSIYPEHLPSWLVSGKTPTKLDQFVEHMRAHSTVKVLDLRPCMLEAKKRLPVFLKTDTHWNRFGGFVGYQDLINSLSGSFPDLAPLPFSSFQCAATPPDAGGDLALLLGDAGMLESQGFSLQILSPHETLTATPHPLRLKKGWTKETEPRITINPKATRKAILFRDSFSVSWYNLIGQHFKEVIYIWEYIWDPAFLEREKPDVVIDEMVERFLNNQDPKELMKKDALVFNK